jgi:lysophospholipase L1-like esterase
VVNCADPGFTLKRMLNRIGDPVFQQMLFDGKEHAWDGLLISGLGNDLIDALSAKPSAPGLERLLFTKSEWGAEEKGPARYVSEAGWEAFKAYANRSKHNKSVRIITHTYDLATPRNSPAGPSGPWLFTALTAYGIPKDDWCGLVNEMLKRLSDLLCDEISKAILNVHVIKTQGVLTPAPEGSKGRIGHWANEIHPSAKGYALLGETWNKELQALYC